MRVHTLLKYLGLSLAASIAIARGQAPDERHLDFSSLMNTLRGDDLRLFRWSAVPATVRAQNNGGCAQLEDVLTMLMGVAADKVKALACEYATFCITDNPGNRAFFSQQDGIHATVVNLVQSPLPYASAKASHLIYIATYTNKENHQAFQKAGAVAALASVLKDPKARNVQLMWAAAALQNLAASYCASKDDGCCYWEWRDGHDNVVLTDESNGIVSDGEMVRSEMLEDAELVQRLVELSCTGPVDDEDSDEHPYPGGSAIAGRHDDSSTIVAWAAAGALQNLALTPAAKPNIEPALSCFCRLAYSPDWLESAKGETSIYHLRRNNPCWYGTSGDEYPHGKLCLDHDFLDGEGFPCPSHDDASPENCSSENEQGVAATTACCSCGGGSWEGTESKDEL